MDGETGRIIAGPLDDDGATMLDSMALITSPDFKTTRARAGENTTIGVVATNAKLNKAQANKLASAAHDGLALAVRPAHLMSDGDTIFALATGQADAGYEPAMRGGGRMRESGDSSWRVGCNGVGRGEIGFGTESDTRRQ